MHRIFVEVDAVVQRSLRVGVEVLFEFQQLCRTVEVVEDKLVGVFQRSAPHGFIAQIVFAQDNSQLAGGVLIAFVCLAEELHQLRVGECTGKVSFAAALVQLVEILVVGGLFPHGVRAVEHEVAAVDNIVQRTVHGFDVGIGGFDFFPAPDVAVHIGVAVHSVHQVGLYVGQQRQVARIEVFAPESVVDTYDSQVYVGYRLQRLVERNAVFRHFVQTGDGRQRHGNQHDI